MSNDGEQLEEFVSRAADPTLGKVCQYQWEQRPLGVEFDPLLHGPCYHRPVQRVEETGPFDERTMGYKTIKFELCREHLAVWNAKRVFKPLEPQSIQSTLDSLSYGDLKLMAKMHAPVQKLVDTRTEQIKAILGDRFKEKP